MAWAAWNIPAEIVHVTGTPLTAIAILHRLRFRSRIVLDVQERPGMVAANGSLTRVFSRFEAFVLRAAAPRTQLATVVTHGDVAIVRKYGFPSVQLVRNAPLSGWRAPYSPPSIDDPGLLKAVVIGTVFEGRGYEILIRALAKARGNRAVQLKVCGPGRSTYIHSLKVLAAELGLSREIEWVGSVDSGEVSALYLEAHVGLVLYEGADPGNDGLSNKILECVSSGRPVIAGDLPENRRFVETHRVGWLTSVTVDDLAAVLSNPELTTDLNSTSERCRQYGDAWLNWESEFEKVLRSLQMMPGNGSAISQNPRTSSLG